MSLLFFATADERKDKRPLLGLLLTQLLSPTNNLSAYFCVLVPYVSGCFVRNTALLATGLASSRSGFLCFVKSGTEENLPRCQGGDATSPLQNDLLLPDELLIPALVAGQE